MIMRDGHVVQIGRPEELVARPADAYVEDFVRDIPKSHVLTLRWVMRPPTPADPVDGAVFRSDTVIRTVIHAAAASDKPIRVIDDGQLMGVVDRAHILETVAGPDPDGEPGVAVEPTGGAARRDRTPRVEFVGYPYDGAANVLAEAVGDGTDLPNVG
jgi:hypothetical protein